MANSHLTLHMITRESILLFKSSNMFIASLDGRYSTLFVDTVVKSLTAKETIVLGTAAILANNPKITRRFWSISK